MSSNGPFAAVNHAGFVVTDLAAAGAFVVQTLGFERIVDRRGSIAFPGTDVTRRLFGVDPDATAEFAFFRLGDAVVELLQWQGPNRATAVAGNSDLAGRHLALTVSDMDAAIGRLSALEGVEVREPNERGYVYVKTPIGLELQLIPAT